MSRRDDAQRDWDSFEEWTEAERERIARLPTEAQISASTSFDQGMEFRDEGEVRAYFDRESLREMVDFDETISAELLDHWADLVVKHQWHCASMARASTETR
jgi:hypothetical protein